MDPLTYDFMRLARKRSRSGSHVTRANRKAHLRLIARELREEGYRNVRAKNIKPKHVRVLVARWQREELNLGTIKNRLSSLRWATRELGRVIIPASNAALGLGTRRYVTNASKACELEGLHRVTDRFVRISLELERAFGLRREEAIKFQPGYADRGDRIALKASWCKGGRPREIPMRSADQRALLERARQVAAEGGAGSLIPATRTFKQQLAVYEKQLTRAGLSKQHGLRHAYSQERYLELTGWEAPAAGGPSAGDLDASQREVDRFARQTIAEELGHGRSQITSVYLGR